MTLIEKSRRGLFGLFAGIGALALLGACDVPAGLGVGNTKAVDANATVKVALMVPLNSGQGELEFLGSSLVNSARLARNDLAGVTIDLEVYPTGGDAATAAAAASRAVSDGAQIIVGPLFSTAATSVAPIAAQAGIPVLSFSNNSDIAGNNVYLLGMTFDTIAQRVVSYAAGQGRTNIAVVHSNDVAGLAGRAAAERAIQRAGASFAGGYGYELSPAGISQAAPDIAASVKAAGANAVVFTDDPASGLVFLTPVLASSGLKAGPIQYLGLTRWNVPQEAATTPSMQGGVFAVPDPNLQAQFEARYVATYGAAPHPLAGLAYDGIAAIGAMVNEARAAGTPALSPAQITSPAGFVGVNGVFRFRADGSSDRGLALMQLRDGAAVVIDPAPRGFGASGS